jgi:hypothetical protein
MNPLFESIREASAAAAALAHRSGEPVCIISRFSRKRGIPLYRVLPLAGFGLPPGWTFEDTVQPGVGRRELDPPEKTSTNGF